MPYECPRCLKTSHNPIDALVGWCGLCEAYTRDQPDRTRAIAEQLREQGKTSLADTVLYRLDGQ